MGRLQAELAQEEDAGSAQGGKAQRKAVEHFGPSFGYLYPRVLFTCCALGCACVTIIGFAPAARIVTPVCCRSSLLQIFVVGRPADEASA